MDAQQGQINNVEVGSDAQSNGSDDSSFEFVPLTELETEEHGQLTFELVDGHELNESEPPASVAEKHSDEADDDEALIPEPNTMADATVLYEMLRQDYDRLLLKTRDFDLLKQENMNLRKKIDDQQRSHLQMNQKYMESSQLHAQEIKALRANNFAQLDKLKAELRAERQEHKVKLMTEREIHEAQLTAQLEVLHALYAGERKLRDKMLKAEREEVEAKHKAERGEWSVTNTAELMVSKQEVEKLELKVSSLDDLLALASDENRAKRKELDVLKNESENLLTNLETMNEVNNKVRQMNSKLFLENLDLLKDKQSADKKLKRADKFYSQIQSAFMDHKEFESNTSVHEKEETDVPDLITSPTQLLKYVRYIYQVSGNDHLQRQGTEFLKNHVEFISLCEDFIVAQITKDNAFANYKIGEDFLSLRIKDACVKCIKMNIAEILCTKESFASFMETYPELAYRILVQD